MNLLLPNRIKIKKKNVYRQKARRSFRSTGKRKELTKTSFFGTKFFWHKTVKLAAARKVREFLEKSTAPLRLNINGQRQIFDQETSGWIVAKKKQNLKSFG
jgi:hypothetical protein